jgi:hypothetical protein
MVLGRFLSLLLAATLWPQPPAPAELSRELLNQPLHQEKLNEPVGELLDTGFCRFADSENHD